MARRFRFRLDTVQRLRERARDAQRRALAEAARVVARTQERIQRLSDELQQTMVDSRTSLSGASLDIVSMRGHQYYRGWLHRKIMEAQADLAGEQTRLESERAKLAEASKHVKVIELLRERRWKEYCSGLAREEQAENDEAAGQQLWRQTNEALHGVVA